MKKRTKDRALLNYMQGLPCLICSKIETTVGHHIKTKKTGGPDEPWNLVPLCYAHHMEVHKDGSYVFSKTYGEFKAYLEYWKWELIENNGSFKWIPPEGER